MSVLSFSLFVHVLHFDEVFLKNCLSFLCGTFYNLFNELGDKLKFTCSPDVIICG